MQSVKKVTLVPAKENQKGGGNAEAGSLVEPVEKTIDKIKSKIYDKIHRFIKIILKLARTVGYDEDLRIKLTNGKYLEKSNIVDLLTHAMSVGKVLYGENEFIELLAASDVNPDLIINDNVRLKLIQYKNKNKKSYRQEELEEAEVEQFEEPENQMEITKNDVEKPKFYNDGEEIKIVKKGAKRLITVGGDKKDNLVKRSKNNVIIVGKDGATVNLDNARGATTSSSKRKISDSDEENVDDDQIDSNQWVIN